MRIVLTALYTASFVLLLSHAEDAQARNEQERYPVLELKWEETKIPLTIAIWVFIACLAKMVFNLSTKVAEIFPDSSLLILVGLLVGIMLNSIKVERNSYKLGDQVFFLYLLPPMMFDAGFNMPARAFFDNLGTCVVFALIGTAWNIAAIGVSLWAISLTGLFSVKMSLLELLLFGSVVADVDPVAVIVFFEEMGVNELLYISVFGESVLNDGISVVIYRMLNTFTKIGADNLITRDYLFGMLSFVVIAIGGIAVGLFFALVSGFLTKYTDNVPVLNPVLVFLIPFATYLICETIGMSSILGIVFCGVAMRPYVRENLSKDAFRSVQYFVKVFALASETVIFIFLGLSTVSNDHHWDTSFVALTCIFCLVYRAAGVFVLCALLNMGRLKRFTKVDEFIIAFGGLRGAIAYGLVVALPDEIPAKNLFVTSCIVVIYFTVFLQGMTLKPIANFLQVEKKTSYDKGMIDVVYENALDNTMTGIELIMGRYGHQRWRSFFERINHKVLVPLLVKKEASKKVGQSNLVRAADRLAEQEATIFAETMEAWYHSRRLESQPSQQPNGQLRANPKGFICDESPPLFSGGGELPTISVAAGEENRYVEHTCDSL